MSPFIATVVKNLPGYLIDYDLIRRFDPPGCNFVDSVLVLLELSEQRTVFNLVDDASFLHDGYGGAPDVEVEIVVATRNLHQRVDGVLWDDKNGGQCLVDAIPLPIVLESVSESSSRV